VRSVWSRHSRRIYDPRILRYGRKAEGHVDVVVVVVLLCRIEYPGHARVENAAQRVPETLRARGFAKFYPRLIGRKMLLVVHRITRGWAA
jgi:hypothetical protein